MAAAWSPSSSPQSASGGSPPLRQPAHDSPRYCRCVLRGAERHIYASSVLLAAFFFLPLASSAAAPPPLSARRAASWWSDLDNIRLSPAGSGSYAGSELQRLCRVSTEAGTTAARWSALACSGLEASTASGATRLLLIETDSKPSSQKSWRNLLDLKPRKKGAEGIFKGDGGTIPDWSDLELVPRSEVTLLKQVSGGGSSAIYAEQSYDHSGYPGELKQVRVSLTPNGVRFVSLGAHRVEGAGARVAVFSIAESTMRAMEARLTTDKEPSMGGEAPEETEWGSELFGTAQQHFTVGVTGATGGVGGDTCQDHVLAGDALALALATAAVRTGPLCVRSRARSARRRPS